MGEKFSRRDLLKVIGAGAVDQVAGRMFDRLVEDYLPSRPNLFQSLLHVGERQATEINWPIDPDRYWKELSPKDSPGPLYRSGMIYDTERRHFMMHGGMARVGGLDVCQSATWKFDGKNWAKLDGDQTPSVVDHSMVSTSLGPMIAFGLVQEGTTLDETGKFFVYENNSWREVVPSSDQTISRLQGRGVVSSADGNTIWFAGGAADGNFFSHISRAVIGSDGNITYSEMEQVGQEIDKVFHPLMFRIPGGDYIYVYGGIKEVPITGGKARVYSDTCWQFKPTDGSNQVTIEEAPFSRSGYGGKVRGGCDDGGQLVLYGGFSPGLFGRPIPYATVCNLLIPEWKMVDTTSQPQYLDGVSMAIDPSGRALIYGGVGLTDNVMQDKTLQILPKNKTFLPLVAK